MKQKVLVLGATGMLGHKLVQVLSDLFDVRATIRRGYPDIERLGIFRPEQLISGVDAEDLNSIRSAIRDSKPDVVINAIGIVKQAPSSKNVAHVLRINSLFPHALAELTREFGFRLVTLSTDCVFSGGHGSYKETDLADATDLYGQSKHWGEVSEPNCLTLRTSIIGRELRQGHSLVEWFLSQRNAVKGYSNAFFSGFPTVVLADLIGDVIENHPQLAGVYHVSSDPISKFDLLQLVKNRVSLPIKIEKESEFRIDRSLDSTEFRRATEFAPLPWPEMVDRMLSDPTPYDQLRTLS